MTAKQFKEIRILLGLTQTEFAKAIGYKSFATICRKEAGKVSITNQDIITINFLLPKPKKNKV